MRKGLATPCRLPLYLNCITFSSAPTARSSLSSRTRKWPQYKHTHYFGGRKTDDAGKTIDKTGWSKAGLGGNRHHWQLTRYKLQRDKNGQLTLPKSKSTKTYIKENGIEYKDIKGQRRQGWRVPWGGVKQRGGNPSSHALSAEDGPESYELPVEEQTVFVEFDSVPNEIVELLKAEIAAAELEPETLGAASTAPTPLSASCSGFIGVTDLCQYPSLAKPAPGHVAPKISQMLATSLFGLIDAQ